MLLLIGVPCALDKQQLVLLGVLHMIVDTFEKARRVAVGEGVERANQERRGTYGEGMNQTLFWQMPAG